MSPVSIPDTDLTADAYREQIDRLVARFRTLSADDMTRRVPACPAWTVREVLAHLAGNAQDIGSGNTDNAGSDEWTAAQVDRLAGKPAAEVIDILEAESVATEAALRTNAPKRSAQVVMDTTTHEHDLHNALGIAAHRDARQVEIGLTFLLQTIHDIGAGFGLPPLQIEMNGEPVVLGGDTPEITMAGSPFEMLRAWSGRRTVAEVQALVTSGDLTPYTDVMLGPASPLGFAETSLGE